MMSYSPGKPNTKKTPCWRELWLESNKKPLNLNLNHVFFTMHLQSLDTKQVNSKLTSHLEKTIISNLPKTDLISQLSDDILLRILSKLPQSQRNSTFLVCKRWLLLQGRLVQYLKLLDFNFLLSGRLISRFPNLTHIDLVHACVISPPNSAILLTHKLISFHVDSRISNSGFIREDYLLSVDAVDRCLEILASGCPNLRKVVVIGCSELGLLRVAEECPILLELELRKCNDRTLRAISAFQNLQILKLIGNVDGFGSSLVSDIGLTILAEGCKRLVKLELSGCEGSYDGIKAIGQCCQILEELSLCDHRMDDGWLSALFHCESLKTLRFRSCRYIDLNPELYEQLGYCPVLEQLHLQRCQLRDEQSLRALFIVCRAVKEMAFQDCWGFDNNMFSMASTCRRVKSLSIKACSLITTEGLEFVVLSLKELQGLRVESCKNIKDSEITPALSTLFSVLKELKWRPDSRSILSSRLGGTCMGKRGGKFFKRAKLGL